MSANSKIEWTDHTWNPWMGCTKVSKACDNCYAEKSTPARTMGIMWGAGQPRKRTSESNWRLPERWNKAAAAFHAKHGRRQRVFCASLADLFDNEVPDAWREELFALIEATPHLDWLLLTKRIGNVQRMVPARWMAEGFPAHVQMGITVATQDEADRDIQKLVRLPARVLFLSMEPLLEAVDISDWLVSRYPFCSTGFQQGANMEEGFCQDCGGHVIDPIHVSPEGNVTWVIVGGESGANARPMDPAWVRDIRDQCENAGVPFLFKQWGEWGQWRQGLTHEGPECGATRAGLLPTRHYFHDKKGAVRGLPVLKVGKKVAGRTLDGELHDSYPPSTFAQPCSPSPGKAHITPTATQGITA